MIRLENARLREGALDASPDSGAIQSVVASLLWPLGFEGKASQSGTSRRDAKAARGSLHVASNRRPFVSLVSTSAS